MPAFQLIQNGTYCTEYTKLNTENNFLNLYECAEKVSLSKGEKGCNATNGIFFTNATKGHASGYCFCSRDDCTNRSWSSTNLTIYKLLDGKILNSILP